MVDLRRLSTVFAVGLASALVGTIGDTLLSLALGPRPDWIVPKQQPLGWNLVDTADSTITGLERQYRRGQIAIDEPLAVYIGHSTARQGIDPILLDDEAGASLRFFGLCGSGGNFQQFEPLCETFLRSHLRPKLVVLCIHPLFLAGIPTDVHEVPTMPGFELNNFGLRVRKLSWIGSNRTFINHRLRLDLRQLRTQTLDNDENLEAFAPPAREPFQASPPFDYPEHMPASSVANQLQAFESYGWFEPAAYAVRRDEQYAALARLLTRIQQLGAEVMIIFMPEHETLRQRVPPSAESFLLDSLGRDFDVYREGVVDLRTALRDDEFCDLAHPNSRGRAKLSRQLGATIRDWKADEG